MENPSVYSGKTLGFIEAFQAPTRELPHDIGGQLRSTRDPPVRPRARRGVAPREREGQRREGRGRRGRGRRVGIEGGSRGGGGEGEERGRREEREVRKGAVRGRTGRRPDAHSQLQTQRDGMAVERQGCIISLVPRPPSLCAPGADESAGGGGDVAAQLAGPCVDEDEAVEEHVPHLPALPSATVALIVWEGRRDWREREGYGGEGTVILYIV